MSCAIETWILIAIIAVLVWFIVGLLVWYFTKPPPHSSPSTNPQPMPDGMLVGPRHQSVPPLFMKSNTTLVEGAVLQPDVASTMTIPDAYDLRQAYPGLVTPALNQETCESCWAFSCATAISDAVRIKYRNGSTQEPTSQYLTHAVNVGQINGVNIPNMIDNISPYYFDACILTEAQGGNTAFCRTPYSIPSALSYMQQNKGRYVSFLCRVAEGLYAHYECEDPTKTTGCIKYSIDSYSPAGSEKNIQQAILNGTPVVTGIQVYTSFNSWWAAGAINVYKHDPTNTSDNPTGGHGVTIVGWGVDPNEGKYWIIRNSWGMGQGELGYFKMARGIDNCGVESQSYQFTVSMPETPPPDNTPAPQPGPTPAPQPVPPSFNPTPLPF